MTSNGRILLFSIFFSSSSRLSTQNQLDFRTCYNGGSTPIFCNKDSDKTNPHVCFHAIIHSNITSNGFNIYGCSDSQWLPQECFDSMQYFFPLTKLYIQNKTVHGSLFCCNYDNCNELNESPFNIIKIKNSSVWQLDLFWAFIISYFLCVASTIPLINGLLNERRKGSFLRAEKAHILQEASLKIFEEVFDYQMLHLSQCFPSLRALRDVLNMMEKECLFKQKEIPCSQYFLNKKVMVIQRDVDEPKNVFRSVPTKYVCLASRLIEHGPFKFEFDPTELGDMFNNVAQILQNEPSIVDLSGDTYVYGNLDGNYGEMFRWFLLNGWPPNKKVIFLGGLTDQDSDYSLELLSLIFALKQKMPHQVFIVRGASEVYPLNISDRFPKRASNSLIDIITRAYGYLPLAVLIENKILCVHGGLPSSIKSLSSLREISRPIYDLEKKSIASDVIFSQSGTIDIPIPGARGWYFNGEGDDYNKRLTQFNVDLIIRSRNAFKNGYQMLGAKTLSIYSTTNKKEKMAASMAYISPTMQVELRKMLPPKYIKIG